MFETVAPETFHAKSRKVLYESLPLSIAVHAAAIGAAVVIASWNIVFPEHSPRMMASYSLATIPEPPPPPPPPPAGQPAPKVVAPAPAVPPDQVVAPTVIPDVIPMIPDPPPPSLQTLAPAAAAAAAPAGVPNGSEFGKLGGELGGDIKGVAGGVVFQNDGKVHIALNESLPLEPISQEYPSYPDEAKKKQLEDQVIVRYTIGTDGRVNDVQILDHATQPMFDKAAVDAIKLWRFRPMVKNGKRVEVVHDLAINFVLVRH